MDKLIQCNILGTSWVVEFKRVAEDPLLETLAGYTDKTSRRIVIGIADDSSNLDDIEVFSRKLLRHEVIHAFLFESGIAENYTPQQGHDEAMIDWFAIQFPKIYKVFKKLKCDIF